MKKRFLIGLGIALVLVFVARTIHVQAQNGEFEVLYLSDIVQFGDGETILFRVDLDPLTGHANLTPLPAPLPDVSHGPGVIPFDTAAAIGATPDGSKLYCIDEFQSGRGNGMLGYYDVGTASWEEVDIVYLAGTTTPVPEIVLAAFSPDGILYAASEKTNSLYIVDTETAEATLVGLIKNQNTLATVNVSGADIAFAADSTLYLWANNAAPRGLYILTVPETIPGTVDATHLGVGGTGSYFTGLAIRENGLGDLVGSTHEGEIFIVDKTNGTTVDTFYMYLEDEPYIYGYGDMTVGPLVLCTRTIGYWKNHSWDDATVTINMDTIDEKMGRSDPVEEKSRNGILWLARGNNFSMLYAQLIAAKLNCGDCVGITILDEAEDFLSNQVVFWDNFDIKFVSKAQKKGAAKLAEALDAFNNQFPCEED